MYTQTPTNSIEQVRDTILRVQPKIIVILGKTCTGKSTFAKSLSKFGYNHLELDFIVRQYVADKFKLTTASQAFNVYNGSAPIKWQKSFETATRSNIIHLLKTHNLVVDAAIAKPEVLKNVFNNEISNFLLIFFHPFDRQFYFASLAKRLENDILTSSRSFPIWDFITPEILTDYQSHGTSGHLVSELISSYCDESIAKSSIRLKAFMHDYPELLLTGH